MEPSHELRLPYYLAFCYGKLNNEIKKAVIIQSDVLKEDLLLLESKLIEKIADPSNAKEYYNPYLKIKNVKLIKWFKDLCKFL